MGSDKNETHTTCTWEEKPESWLHRRRLSVHKTQVIISLVPNPCAFPEIKSLVNKVNLVLGLFTNVIQWARDGGTETCSHSFHTLYWWLVSSALTVVCTLLVPRGESGESLPVLPEVPIRRPETQQENTDIHNTPWTHRLLIVRTNVLHKDKVKCPLTRQGTSEVHSQTKFVLSLQLITCKEWYRLRLASCQGVV